MVFSSSSMASTTCNVDRTFQVLRVCCQRCLYLKYPTDAREIYPNILQKVLQLLQDGSLHHADFLIAQLQRGLLYAHVTNGGDLIQDFPEVLQHASDPLRVVQHQLQASIQTEINNRRNKSMVKTQTYDKALYRVCMCVCSSSHLKGVCMILEVFGRRVATRSVEPRLCLI